MAKKAAWILVLLVALMVISVSVAFAASVNRPAQASLAPSQELSAGGKVNVTTLRGYSGGRFQHVREKTDSFTHCHLEDAAAAY